MTVVLKPGRERPVLTGHPWIFSGAIDRVEGEGVPGALVQVLSAQGQLLGTGYLNPGCSIAERMLSRADEPVDAAFMRRRLNDALSLRRSLLPPDTNAFRCVNGEGDFLPGLVIDVYGPFAVCQFLTAGADLLRDLVLTELVGVLGPEGVYEKSEGGVRREEGLRNQAGMLWGVEPPPLVEIREADLVFPVDVRGGQKTGFFLDQRDNRSLVGAFAGEKSVLDAFAYSGGFGASAARGGAARVVSVETSPAALELSGEVWRRNHLPADKAHWIRADAFHYLRTAEEVFDLVVLDPPPFVRRKQDLRAGVGGYKEINLQALRRISPGGWLFTFSCSQHVSRELFTETVMSAAAHAGRTVQILRRLGPAADHPVGLAHPEGEYLNGLWLRAL